MRCARPAHAVLLAVAVSLISTVAAENTAACRDAAANVLIIGVRTDAPPFAWRRSEASGADANRRNFLGYSVELCDRIAERAIRETAFEQVCWRPVTAQDRFQRLANGDIHLLCGAPTVTLARMREVDFSLFTFLSGTSILYNARAGRERKENAFVPRIGVLKGTTTQRKAERIADDFYQWQSGPGGVSAGIDLIEYCDHDKAVAAIVDGAIDAYLADREILLVLQQKIAVALREHSRQKTQGSAQQQSGDPSRAAARSPADDRAGDTDKKGTPPARPSDIKVSERYFSYEPYAIGINKDQRELRISANEVLAELYGTPGGRINPGIATILAHYFPRKQFSDTLKTLFKVQRIPAGTPIDKAGDRR